MSFSGDGMRITDFGGSDDGARAVALQADGKIVAVGGGGDHDFVLARYNPNGSLDTSFSGDGKQIIDWGGLDWAEGGGDPDGRQDRRGRTWRPPPSRLRTRPLQPQRVARP